ncbi:hypothetical protein LSM04_001812 [Trypanosoma melophagium]|uniref:uncharacterized protein n=1 Tax=Trypanosoma melophagium TaxID=715481 RepID=UPI00351A0BD3|nr:hypothetical protein LSM04_001812 [Trypanosoma melophagium]
MSKRTNSVTVSVSTRTSVTQYGGSCFSEMALPIYNTKQAKIPRLYPVLAAETDAESNVVRKGLPFTETSLDSPIFTAFAAAPRKVSPVKGGRKGRNIRKASVQPVNEEFVVKWKDLTIKEIEFNLVPFKIHYQLQLLVLEERRKRRMIANEEFTGRLENYMKCRYSAPVRERLLNGIDLDTISDQIHLLCRRNRHSSSVVSMSLRNLHSVRDDPLHIPCTSAISNDLTPWTGDSQITYTLKSDDGLRSRGLEPLVGTVKHERPTKERSDEPNRHCTPQSVKQTSDSETVTTVTRCLNVSGISAQSEGSGSSPNEKESDVDSLAQSLMGSPIRSDGDSFGKTLATETQTGDDDGDNDDDSRGRSLNHGTMPGFYTPTGDDEKEN